jgi:hypothetical protein
MAVISKSKIERSLSDKGFKKEGNDRKHDYWYLYFQNKKTGIRTTMSRSSKYKEYDEGALSLKQKDLKLDTKKQTVAFLNCPMNGQDYLQFLLNKGIRI